MPNICSQTDIWLWHPGRSQLPHVIAGRRVYQKEL